MHFCQGVSEALLRRQVLLFHPDPGVRPSVIVIYYRRVDGNLEVFLRRAASIFFMFINLRFAWDRRYL